MKENEASSTAYSVLQGLLHVGRQPRYAGLVSKETTDAGTRILASTEQGRRRLAQLDSALFRAAVPLLETLLVPGLSLHYALRKRFIEDETLKAIDAGATQVVNLGAGFDTLAWRLHDRFADVNFIEIDHPATSAAKAVALKERAAGSTNLHMLEVDFTHQTLKEMLGGFAGFLADRPTLYICEGVMAYLTVPQVTELLATLIALSTVAPPRLVCTCVEPMELPDNNTGPLLSTYLRIKGEAIMWRIAHDQVAAFLAERDFAVDAVVTHKEFTRDYLSGLRHGTVHRGEYGVVAHATHAGSA